MEGQEYFKQALSNFTFDAACGGEIRHLADLGYTVKQIAERLSYPAPYGKVQQAVWKHLADTGVLLMEEPGAGAQRKMPVFVKEYDKYGKPSFRRINGKATGWEAICWKERHFRGKGAKELRDFLSMQCGQNGETCSYVSCSFGLIGQADALSGNVGTAGELSGNVGTAGGLAEWLSVLGQRQQEYILGLPWERKIVYHRLDQRMREIVAGLYGAGRYHGILYFQKSGEKAIF